jgi:hypothetical protein
MVEVAPFAARAEAAHEIGGERWQAAVIAARPAERDRDILAVDKAALP